MYAASPVITIKSGFNWLVMVTQRRDCALPERRLQELDPLDRDSGAGEADGVDLHRPRGMAFRDHVRRRVADEAREAADVAQRAHGAELVHRGGAVQDLATALAGATTRQAADIAQFDVEL
jgi:hypothetical protein